MEDKVLKVQELTKKYGSMYALKNVSMELEAGRIYGLIGQNGAGKTTLMRLIAGLGFPTGGSVYLFGKTGEKALMAERSRLGCMIEYPSLNPGMTAEENMHMYRIMRGIPDKGIEKEMLKQVGLSDTGRKKVKNFSLGMKQRLGIASALIGRPELLVLDEPINGLDPVGVVEIRNLLKSLREELGMTVLISSHNLPELYQVATDYIIIHQGMIIQQLSHGELDERCMQHLLIRARDQKELVSVLEMELHASNYQVMPDGAVKLYDFNGQQDRIAGVLYDKGVVVTSLSEQGDTLENYYISVIGGKGHV